MTGYTKADFYAAYSGHLIDPDTGVKYARYQSPELPHPVTVLLHYHPLRIKPMKKMLAKIVVKKMGIQQSDRVVIFGGAYGWLGEAIQNQVQCKAISVDASDYVQETKNASADDELIEAIQLGDGGTNGLSVTEGVGKELFDKFSDPSPRSKIPVLNVDMVETTGATAVVDAFGKLPTKIITEEVWQLLNDAERVALNRRFAKFGCEVLHIINGAFVDGVS